MLRAKCVLKCFTERHKPETEAVVRGREIREEGYAHLQPLFLKAQEGVSVQRE